MKVALYKGTGWLSKAILFMSRGGYSHAAMVLNNGSIIESFAPGGVRTRTGVGDGIYANTYVDVFDVNTSAEQDIIIQEFLKKQIGKGYDYWAIIGFIIHTTHEGRIGYGRWICSELVFAAFQKAGINLLERVECWKVSPTILSYSSLLKNARKLKVIRAKRFLS